MVARAPSACSKAGSILRGCSKTNQQRLLTARRNRAGTRSPTLQMWKLRPCQVRRLGLSPQRLKVWGSPIPGPFLLLLPAHLISQKPSAFSLCASQPCPLPAPRPGSPAKLSLRTGRGCSKPSPSNSASALPGLLRAPKAGAGHYFLGSMVLACLLGLWLPLHPCPPPQQEMSTQNA